MKHWRPALIGVMIAVFAAGFASAATSESDISTKVKAAYLLNFARFTTWPDSAFSDTNAEKTPFVIIVLGDDKAGIANVLSLMVRKETVHNRAVVVRRLDYPRESEPERQNESIRALRENLAEAHMLFIDSSLQKSIADVLKDADDDRLLLVSDCRNFAAHGGMIGLAEKDSKIFFEANPDAIAESSVEVSSKILRLAQIVRTTEHD